MKARRFAIGGLVIAAFIGVVSYAMTRGSTVSQDDIPGMTGMSHDGSGNMPGILPAGDISGLHSTSDGYALQLVTTKLSLSSPGWLSFRVLGDGRKPVLDFQVEATKKMHLLIVRRDLAHYQHVHPTMTSNGTWTVHMVVPAPGKYRVFADFATGGKRRVLGADLTAPGAFTAVPLPKRRTTTRVDGYEVTLHAGMLMPSTEAAIRFTVSRDGQPVTSLQPYLGNLGHLVILRENTLQYLHVHPTSSGGAGPEIRFSADLPRRGRYRAFLQFQAGGTVHMAAFTLEAHAM